MQSCAADIDDLPSMFCPSVFFPPLLFSVCLFARADMGPSVMTTNPRWPCPWLPVRAAGRESLGAILRGRDYFFLIQKEAGRASRGHAQKKARKFFVNGRGRSNLERREFVRKLVDRGDSYASTKREK
jgi:hypothetical protein